MDADILDAGRARAGQADTVIATVSRELLAESGYDGLTFAAVAERAGLTESDVRRRHPTRPELAFAAAVHDVAVGLPPNSGSLLGDLRGLAVTIVEHLNNPAASRTVMSLLAEVDRDPLLMSRFVSTFVRPEIAANAGLLDRAVKRGELKEAPDAEFFHAMFAGTILHWLFLQRNDPQAIVERIARFAHAALVTLDRQAETDSAPAGW
jgi:AcrR family transcriptional regulator